MEPFKVNKTIFHNKIVNKLMYFFAVFILKITGWKIEGSPIPLQYKKYVILIAPHTSNWDFPIGLLCTFAFKVKSTYYLGKHTLVQNPFGFFLSWIGMLPVDRRNPKGTVENLIKFFKNSEELKLVIPPSGTRSDVKKWKTGFYRIALGAKVPIALGYLDYKKKEGGFLGLFHPTGDQEKDIEEIQKKYMNITGKFSERQQIQNIMKA